MSADAPMGLALVACDTVIEDKVTGKKSLIGLCDRIAGTRFPCVHPELSVYVSLTSGRGERPCAVTCRHTDDVTVAFTATGKIRFRDPTQVVDLVFRLRGVRFVKPGTYWLQFLVDDMPIMVRPLTVSKIEKRKQDSEG
mgnify:CR=1 FL=1